MDNHDKEFFERLKNILGQSSGSDEISERSIKRRPEITIVLEEERKYHQEQIRRINIAIESLKG